MMSVLPTANLVFLAAALLLFAVWGWPHLWIVCIVLLSRKVRCMFAEAGDGVPEEDVGPETQQIIEALHALGFSLLGVKLEWRPLHHGKELAFAAEQQQCFASIHGFARGKPHYYFYTPFTDGAVVLTSDLPVDPVKTDTFFHGGLANTPPRRVLDLHLRHVQRMIADGHQPYETYDRASRIEATYAYYANRGAAAVRGKLLLRGLVQVGFSLGLVVLALLLLLWTLWS
jgi:hypothetical protein